MRMRLLKLPGRYSGSRLEAQAFFNKIDIRHRVEACAYRPQHGVEVAGIYVRIDDNGPLAGISAALTV